MFLIMVNIFFKNYMFEKFLFSTKNYVQDLFGDN